MNFRCEFCDIALKSDLDVSKHLVSQTHRDNVVKARELHPLENQKGRDMPTNIGKLFENLKLRTVHDVRDLADRGYFSLSKDATDTCQVIETLNLTLAKKIAGHLCRNMPEATKQQHMNKFNSIKSEPIRPVPARPAVQEPPTRQAPERMSSSKQEIPEPVVQPSAPAASTSEFTPSIDSRPAPAYTPAFAASNRQPTPTSVHAGASRMGQVPSARSVKPNLLCASQVRSTLPDPGTPVVRTISGQQPVIRTTNPVRAPATNVQPLLRPRPDEPQPNVPQSAPRQPVQARPPPTQPRTIAPPIRPTAPKPSVPTSMPNASSMPRAPADFDRPQPRQDSTYRPKLAKIKIEPQDK